jgi:thioredoxin reductase (NADPH)
MEQLYENILTYSVVILLCVGVVFFYVRGQLRKSRKVKQKIQQAKLDGLFEPVSLHPVVDPFTCIGSGACIVACPEKDILGIVDGKAVTINASQCIGHGACFHACPTHAITLVIGTEQRGVELPHVNKNFETNVPGIYIAGELGGMGLIRNSVEQGRQAVDHIAKARKKHHEASYDLVIVGAGPAGISASLAARKHNLSSVTLEQDTLGGAVFNFPRSKIVMTAPMELPLYGKMKLRETSKTALLKIWWEVLKKYGIDLRENTKVESIAPEKDHFRIEVNKGGPFTAQQVLLAIGRRGSPRKLNIPGEQLEKVAYRLLEAENISDKDIVVVGGGDSAIESALLLSVQNRVILSYRGESFGRVKPKNLERIKEAMAEGHVDVRFSTNLLGITEEEVTIASVQDEGQRQQVRNDLVYIFAGGELPTQFLKKTGIEITQKFGEAILKH